jgi:hypothetical protein
VVRQHVAASDDAQARPPAGTRAGPGRQRCKLAALPVQRQLQSWATGVSVAASVADPVAHREAAGDACLASAL